MTVFISEPREGGGVRRCDGACHYAKGDACRCICGGRYHRQGAAALGQFQADVMGGDWDALLPADGLQLRLPMEGAIRVHSFA